MFGHLNDPSPPQPGPEDREAVSKRAQGIKRHRRTIAGVGAAAAIAVAVMVPAVLAGGSGADRHIRATNGGPSTSSATDETTTTSVGQETTTSVASSTTTVKRSPAAAATTTTTALVCRNSTDPRCGPFRWDPAPSPDQPLTGSVTYAPTNPRPGQVVHFYPVADAPDAAFIYTLSCGAEYGDNPNPPPCPVSSSLPRLPNQPPPPRAYGPWTPPLAEHGHCPGGNPRNECQFFLPNNSSRDSTGTCSIDHTYSAAGTYTVKLTFKSFTRPGSPGQPTGVEGVPDPYGDTFTATVTVTVSGTPVTTTTTPGPHTYSTDC